MTTIKLWFSTIKSTFTNLGALAVFAVVYAILLATFFRFIWIREATLSQVFLTYAFMILIPALFFIFQASIIDRVRDGKFRWRVILTDALKFFVITIPILLIAWLLSYLLSKWQLRYPAPVASIFPATPGPPKPAPLHTPSLLFATLRFLLFAVAFPLAAIHLWIAMAGGEVRSLLTDGPRRIGSALARAFAFDSVLIYALGLLIFVGVPYAALFIPLTIKGNKTDFAFFVLRLLLTFVFSLIGWVVTISALTRISLEAAPVVAPDPRPAVPAEAAA